MRYSSKKKNSFGIWHVTDKGKIASSFEEKNHRNIKFETLGVIKTIFLSEGV
jgi:hypothetical protein